MINRLIKIGLAILIVIGFYLLYKSIFLDTALDKVNPLNISNIHTQIFKVNVENDTVIECENGSLLIIRKNSLTDCQGNLVKGEIEVYLKEILTPNDIVKSGISTISDGNMLASDGMLNIEIFKNDTPLCLADSATLSLMTQTDSLDDRMKYFTGDEIGNQINWIKPTDLVRPKQVTLVLTEQSPEGWNQDEISFEDALEIGLITEDTVRSPYYDKLLKSYYDSILQVRKLDNRLYNILEVTKLGWINIDRFIEQNETNPVEFLIDISNGEAYQNLFSKLIFVDINTYLSGYRLGNSKIVFGKSNTEKVRLPLGKEAKILLTCHVNGKTYYHYSEIVIAEKQKIDVSMKQVTDEDLDKLIDTEFN